MMTVSAVSYHVWLAFQCRLLSPAKFAAKNSKSLKKWLAGTIGIETTFAALNYHTNAYHNGAEIHKIRLCQLQSQDLDTRLGSS